MELVVQQKLLCPRNGHREVEDTFRALGEHEGMKAGTHHAGDARRA
jgi:hypothetical protein